MKKIIILLVSLVAFGPSHLVGMKKDEKKNIVSMQHVITLNNEFFNNIVNDKDWKVFYKGDGWSPEVFKTSNKWFPLETNEGCPLLCKISNTWEIQSLRYTGSGLLVLSQLGPVLAVVNCSKKTVTMIKDKKGGLFPRCADLSFDGEKIVYGIPYKFLRIVEIDSGKLLSELETGLFVQCSVFGPDGRVFVCFFPPFSVKTGKTRVWNPGDGSFKETDEQSIYGTWSSDGSIILCLRDPNSIIDVKTMKRWKSSPFDHHHRHLGLDCAVFDSEDKKFVGVHNFGGDGRLEFWRVKKCKEGFTFSSFERLKQTLDVSRENCVVGLAFSPVGKKVVFGLEAGEVFELNIADAFSDK